MRFESSEPCGVRKHDCNTLRGLVSIGNETASERCRSDAAATGSVFPPPLIFSIKFFFYFPIIDVWK